MAKTRQQMNLVKLVEKFHSEEKCRDYLEALRWPEGVLCLDCGSDRVSELESRAQWECLECRYQFSVRTGTIFHNSKLPLWKWFLAVYMMIESKKGISANQVKRTLSVTYKTAWYLCHRIRAAMTELDPAPFGGVVEVDEAMIGGAVTGMGRGYKGNKTIVVGILKRDGEVRLQAIQAANQKTLHSFIKKHTTEDVKAIYTDEWPAYGDLSDKNTKHEKVNHSIEEWTRGEVHTNGIENVWSLLKRSIAGAFHHISAKHLDAYLDELEWRFNNRKNPYLFRDTLRKLVGADHLPYDQLIKEKNRALNPKPWVPPREIRRGPNKTL